MHSAVAPPQDRFEGSKKRWNLAAPPSGCRGWGWPQPLLTPVRRPAQRGTERHRRRWARPGSWPGLQFGAGLGLPQAPFVAAFRLLWSFQARSVKPEVAGSSPVTPAILRPQAEARNGLRGPVLALGASRARGGRLGPRVQHGARRCRVTRDV